MIGLIATALLAASCNTVDRFHISCCTVMSDSENYTTETGARLMAEAGFTRVSGGLKVGRDQKFLDYAAKYGFTVNVHSNPRLCGGGKTHEQTVKGYPMETLNVFLDEMNAKWNHPAISEFNLCDEPGALSMPHLGELAARIRERSQYPIYINLFPNYALAAGQKHSTVQSQLGVESYDKYIERYCETIPVDYIGYDYYPCYDDAKVQRANLPRCLANYKVVADASRRTGRRMQVVQQSNTRPSCRLGPTANKLRFQAYAAMAFGTSELMWACWTDGWGAGWINNMVDHKGQPTEQYYRVKEVNWEVRKIVPTYVKYRNVDTYFVDMNDLAKPLKEKYQIESIDKLNTGFFLDVEATDGSPLLIGDMVSKDPNSTMRALFIATCGDDGDAKRTKHTVRFKARGKVFAYGVDGLMSIAQDATGYYQAELLDNRFLMIELAP